MAPPTQTNSKDILSPTEWVVYQVHIIYVKVLCTCDVVEGISVESVSVQVSGMQDGKWSQYGLCLGYDVMGRLLQIMETRSFCGR